MLTVLINIGWVFCCIFLFFSKNILFSSCAFFVFYLLVTILLFWSGLDIVGIILFWVYLGAVAVLFLIVLMMLHRTNEVKISNKKEEIVIGNLLILMSIVVVIWLVVSIGGIHVFNTLVVNENFYVFGTINSLDIWGKPYLLRKLGMFFFEKEPLLIIMIGIFELLIWFVCFALLKDKIVYKREKKGTLYIKDTSNSVEINI